MAHAEGHVVTGLPQVAALQRGACIPAAGGSTGGAWACRAVGQSQEEGRPEGEPHTLYKSRLGPGLHSGHTGRSRQKASSTATRALVVTGRLDWVLGCPAIQLRHLWMCV